MLLEGVVEAVLLAVEAGGDPSERRLRDLLVEAARLVDRLDLGQSQVRLAVLLQRLSEEKPGVDVAGVARRAGRGRPGRPAPALPCRRRS